jgi:hypothetical protein
MKESPMAQRITVQGIRREEFDVKAFVHALVELARSTSQPVSDDSPDRRELETASDPAIPAHRDTHAEIADNR